RLRTCPLSRCWYRARPLPPRHSLQQLARSRSAGCLSSLPSPEQQTGSTVSSSSSSSSRAYKTPTTRDCMIGDTGRLLPAKRQHRHRDGSCSTYFLGFPGGASKHLLELLTFTAPERKVSASIHCDCVEPIL